MSQPLAVSRTWVFDGTPYEEHSGFKQRMFVVSGRSGFSFTALSRFAKFRNFMEKYANLSAENKNAFERLKDIRLALNFPWEGESYWCTLIDFKYQRSIQTTRISYEYQLTLVTNGPAARKWDPQSALTYVTCDRGDGCHLDKRHFCQAESRNELLLTPTDMQDVIGANDPRLRDLYKRADEGSTNALLTGSAIYYQQLWQESSACFDALYVRFQLLTEPDRTRARISVTVLSRWLIDLRIQCEIELGRRGERTGLSPGQPSTFGTDRPRPVAVQGQLVGIVTVSTGESTAHDVAGRYLGSRNEWPTIVRINGMLDTRTKNDGTPLLANDQLFIPLATGVPFGTDIYGTNFLIVDGDLVAEGDENIALVKGFSNFYQNLRHRLLTTRGVNKAYPGFGLPPLIGTVETSDLPGQVLSNVRRQVMADHRVSTLTEMKLEEEPGTLRVDFTVETVTADKADQRFDYPI